MQADVLKKNMTKNGKTRSTIVQIMVQQRKKSELVKHLKLKDPDIIKVTREILERLVNRKRIKMWDKILLRIF